jgi:quercetin dioxygenase-like cupin family protein
LKYSGDGLACSPLDHDTTYNAGDTWVEIPEDVHYARDEAVGQATILATFILPDWATPSVATDEQLDSMPPAPTVPDLARVPITTSAGSYEVTQFMRTYEPGASINEAPAMGGQTIALVMQGQITMQSGKTTLSLNPGDSWVETSGLQTTTQNPASSAAIVVVSSITPQR